MHKVRRSVVLAGALVLSLPGVAEANSEGVAMGISEAFSCNQCHNATGSFTELPPPEVAPLMVLETVEGSLAVGETTRLRLTAQSQDDQGLGRALGFDVAVARFEEGRSFPTQERDVLAALQDGTIVAEGIGDLMHSRPLEFDAQGIVEVEFEYTPTTGGAKAFYVSLNDVNLNRMAGEGDWVRRDKVCFVPEGATADDAQLGDCTATLTVPTPEDPNQPDPEQPQQPEPETPAQPGDTPDPTANPSDDASAPASDASNSGGCAVTAPHHERSKPPIALLVLGVLGLWVGRRKAR